MQGYFDKLRYSPTPQPDMVQVQAIGQRLPGILCAVPDDLIRTYKDLPGRQVSQLTTLNAEYRYLYGLRRIFAGYYKGEHHRSGRWIGKGRQHQYGWLTLHPEGDRIRFESGWITCGIL